MLEIVFGTAVLIALIIGVYHLGKIDGIRVHLDRDISKYVKDNWPDQYAAYQRGIEEGYAAAMQESSIFPKEPPDEPA